METNMRSINKYLGMVALWMGAILGACGGDDEGGGAGGTLSVLLEPESTIIDGLQAGDDVESIRDGWNSAYDNFIATVGDIDLVLSTDKKITAEAGEVFVVDLKKIAASGLPLWNLKGLRAGRWEFNYATPGAGDGSTRHESVSLDDFSRMKSGDLTYLLRGSITKTEGKSCPPSSLAMPPAGKTPVGKNSGGDNCYDNPTLRFDWAVKAETRFGPCEIDGIPGFAIAANASQTVAVTIHGDHIFFNGFPEGSEGGVLRLAQWIADSDLNLDGAVTQQELEKIAPAALAEIDSRYQLGGSPVTPLNTMWEYLGAQLKTQGHYQGEGECPFDGMEHQHDHDHDDGHSH